MRQPRLKAPRDWARGYYHCVSRVVDRQFILGDEEKGEFINLMRLYEKLCQVRVLTYCLMSNHFHLLVEVPARPVTGMTEETLLELIRSCYGKVHAGLIRAQIEQFRQSGAHDAAQKIIDGWLGRMWDVSSFMKTLKQRFTQWYNKRHGRRGTLWEDRYRSSLIEGEGPALAMVAAYIDLNPVRANLVQDPKDYRWSGYGAACGGIKLAMRGLETIMQQSGLVPDSQRTMKGQLALSQYRITVYGAADTGDEQTRTMQTELGPGAKGNRKGFDHREVAEVRAKGGVLTRGEMLRLRVRYFLDGAVIGTRSFVDGVFHANRDRFGAKREDGARSMKGADFGGLCSLRDLKTRVLGTE